MIYDNKNIDEYLIVILVSACCVCDMSIVVAKITAR